MDGCEISQSQDQYDEESWVHGHLAKSSMNDERCFRRLQPRRLRLEDVGKQGSRRLHCCAMWRYLLGGSWVVRSGVLSSVTRTMTHIWGCIIPLISNHEPQRRGPTCLPKTGKGTQAEM